jgi:hypothetical protein
MDIAAAYRSSQTAHVDFSGTVRGAPRFFYGRTSHAEHEAFNVRTAAGPVEIVDNVDIAPPVPVHDGDRVEVSGEMCHDADKRFPVVHWTHHDPSGHHEGGFIRFNGRVYA